ncbi:hypothetical protein [Marinomonas balearica]|uniref:Uncharacterized protein n=1 Tax=Marinomonas balearica TaxID=491947 RepID=A0A4R6MDW9_9GAMM|nr:hypothetical protein [Marinomonas balearica]TDO99947.1 hypothetical protein DFP79_0960 [Marinomonas balearica]
MESDPILDTFEDIYVLLRDGRIAYISKDEYSDPNYVVESVTVEKGIEQRFFLEEDGVYPTNIAGPAVSKVIDWNIFKAESNIKKLTRAKHTNHYDTGYYIDLRQLRMNRQNMTIVAKDFGPIEQDTPIPDRHLKDTNYNASFSPVPKEYMYQLFTLPKGMDLYIAYYEHPEKIHDVMSCYSYKVAHISANALEDFVITDPSELRKANIGYLEAYYGSSGIQSGALNPCDIRENSDLDPKKESNSAFTESVGVGAGVGGGGGAVCYVANLRTFKD